eukprot:323149-Rhodomonas_salina.4
MLVDINELVSEAETRYQNLLEKYPQSVQLGLFPIPGPTHHAKSGADTADDDASASVLFVLRHGAQRPNSRQRAEVTHPRNPLLRTGLASTAMRMDGSTRPFPASRVLTRMSDARKKAIAMQDDMDMEAVEADPRLQARPDQTP